MRYSIGMKLNGRLEKAALWQQSGFHPPAKSRDRLNRVMEAALDSLQEDGFDRTSFESVGKRCRMRRSHIAYYFKTRDELLNAVFSYVVGCAQQAVVAEIVKADTPADRLRAYVVGHFRWIEREPKKASAVFLFYFMSARSPSFSKHHREVRRVGAERIRAILRSGFGMDARRSKIVAKNIHSLITGALLDRITGGDGQSLATIENTTLDGILQLIGESTSAPARAPRRRVRGEVAASI